MKKTITITAEMEAPLKLALYDEKSSLEKLRQYAADAKKDATVLMYERDIRAIDQILESIRSAAWGF